MSLKSELLRGLTVGTDDSVSGELSSLNGSSSRSLNGSSTDVTKSNSYDGTNSTFSLAKSDSARVLLSKILVFSVIGVCAIGCGTAAFLFARDDQDHDFETHLHVYANEIISMTNYKAANVLSTAHSITTSVTSYALETGAKWPNVTIPNFEARGSISNEISMALQITTSPLIAAKDRFKWEAYANAQQGWIDASLAEGAALGIDSIDGGNHSEYRRMPISSTIKSLDDGHSIGETEVLEFSYASYAPVWQQAPVPHDSSIINFDLLSHPIFRRLYRGIWETGQPALSEAFDFEFLYGSAVKDASDHPHSVLLQPIFPNFSHYTSGESMVAFLTMVLNWDSFFENILHDCVQGIVVVITGKCGTIFSYRLDGESVEFLGFEDKHDPEYDKLKVEAEFAPMLSEHQGFNEQCTYTVSVYPTDDFKESYISNGPTVLAIVVVLFFVFTAMVFAIYDFFVQRRQEKVMETAKRTNAVVASLFPENVRDRVLKDAEEQASDENKNNAKQSVFKRNGSSPTRMQLKEFMDEEEEDSSIGNVYGSKPIADLFPEATVFFADIAGFTAWSSVREPCQVFTLLETIYHAFDEIAKKRRVFKVETIGDCYVAVTGLPEPRMDHAVAMARFAKDCLYSMNNLVKQLERKLGPDTADLSMRMGLHSGPVTAGVLRGDRARFQLFGDTVNTAARVESSGAANRIHLSQETAECLIAAGKVHWVTARKDVVNAKGKGEMKTYWLEIKGQSGASTQSATTENLGDGDDVTEPEPAPAPATGGEGQKKKATNDLDSRTQSLVSWNADVLAKLLKQIIARRKALGQKLSSIVPVADPASKEGTVINEVAEIIVMPEFDAKAASVEPNPNDIELDSFLFEQIENLVTQFALSYKSNPFHNFEHASHVTMSVTKLLSRIVAPDLATSDGASLHDHTYGITSDPLTQFSCVFAALIHDVDHEGVPNAQLVKEDNPLANKYYDQSVAEQNSVDKAWAIFMTADFAELRSTLCPTASEMQRFRQLVVNAVMATDIVDKELKNARNARWEKAFNDEIEEEHPRDANNRKATIVIEHLIQASDVAHTMQHWFVFRKWNERLFHEMFKAYKEGRSASNPSDFWYKGEIGFFDFYVIPLAKKLAACGVFGVSSEEYLNYAMKNRKEWEHRGQEVVAGMIQKYEAMFAEDEKIESQEVFLRDE